MALTKEEAERRWLAKRAKGRQPEDLAAKQRQAAEEAARRRRQNEEAAARQRKAKEELVRKQREVLEAHQREAYEQAERQMPQPEEISGTADAPPSAEPPPSHRLPDADVQDVAASSTVMHREEIGEVPDIEEVLGSIDRMAFFDLGAAREAEPEQLPEPEPPAHAEVVQKPEEDLAGVEERRARLAARARARREAWESKVREAVAEAQVSALARQLRPRGMVNQPTPGQGRPKAAVRMPRRMKIGVDPSIEALQPMQMPSSGLSVGGLVTPLTAQAAASFSSSSAGGGVAPRREERQLPGLRKDISGKADGQEQFVGISADADVDKPMQEVPLDDRHREAISRLERSEVELEDLDDDLRACRQVVLAALRVDGHALAHAAENLRDDRDIVLAAVYESGLAIRHAGQRPRKDREVVLVAVMDAGAALEFAAPELRGNHEVVLTAIGNDSGAVRFAAEALMDDRDFVLAAAQTACRTFEYASARLKRDRDVVMAAVANNPDAFMHAALELRRDRDFVLAAVNANGCAIAHASPELRQDPEVKAVAIANDPLAAAAAQD